MGTKVKPHHFTARSTTRSMLPEKRMGDKPSGVSERRRLCCLSGHRGASIAQSADAVPADVDEGHIALPGLMLCCGRIVVPDGAHAHLGVANGDPSFLLTGTA